MHDINSSIGPENTKGFLFFSTFTDCDVVSASRGNAKSLHDIHGICVLRLLTY